MWFLEEISLGYNVRLAGLEPAAPGLGIPSSIL